MAPFSLNLSCAMSACAKVAEIEERDSLQKKCLNSRVLILGGTGRVGGSTATALSKFSPDLQILIGGRNRDKGAALVSSLGENSQFLEVNIDNKRALEAALKDVDLVVHAAGPFQREEKCTVLEAAIATKTAYQDVCDDTEYAARAKSFHKDAISANVPAITTGGIYPGSRLFKGYMSKASEDTTNLYLLATMPLHSKRCLHSIREVPSFVMAAELVRHARSENIGELERLRFFYYTAGSGGAGPTILATSFLLLGEDVIAYNKGEKIKLKPYSRVLNIDFGKGIGKRDVYLLNLPEVRSAHEVLGVPTVSARFGTAPFFWNWGMVAIANLVPVEILRDKSKVAQLVQIFDPLVRAFDGIAGERVSMRVDLECTNGRSIVGIFSHRRLSVSVGTATAAFALAILEGSIKPGVWFPEEPDGLAIDARELLLERAAQGTINFVMNKAPWMVETDPKEIGLGIYV